MPRNRLSLTVRVRRQIDLLAFGGTLLELLDQLFLALDDGVLGLEVFLDIHTQLGGRQVTHVSHGGRDLVPAAEIFLYTFCFCRGLHND